VPFIERSAGRPRGRSPPRRSHGASGRLPGPRLSRPGASVGDCESYDH